MENQGNCVLIDPLDIHIQDSDTELAGLTKLLDYIIELGDF